MNGINTRKQLEGDLSELKRMILRLGKLGEEAVTKAVWALKSHDTVLAKSVLDNDDRLDNLAGEVDSACMHFTARYQPLGEDLRTVTSIMHMAIDFERIGDYGCNIARVALSLAEKELIKPLIDIPRMVEVLAAMTEKTLSAFSEGDELAAKEVFPMDDLMDDLEKQIMRELLLLMMERPQRIEQASQLLNVARTLERAGDHITNVAERVVYMVTGKTIRASAYRRPKEAS
ncbi:MAG: phosphate signaling complex protein PhoU [Synergistaceae bacterium]|nr:phosphate signaling complex protein PhoU [Synergistaceae bacterium]